MKHLLLLFVVCCAMCASAQSTTNQATVTFKYAYDSNKETPMLITIYNKDVGILPVDKEGINDTFKSEVAHGTYDMHAMFKGKPAGTYAIFKENVIIDKDTTIIFEKSEAIYPITIKTYDEKGTQLSLDKYAGGGVAEPGNVNSFRSYGFFALKDMGVVHTTIGGSYRVKGYDTELYTNKVSERFSFLYTSNMRSLINERTYFFKFETPMGKEITLENDPANLKEYKQKFTPTPEGSKEPNNFIHGFRVWCAFNGEVLLTAKAENKKVILADSTQTLFVDLPVIDETGFVVMVSPMMGDTYQASNNQFKHTVGLPVTGNANGLNFVDYGFETTFMDYIIPVGGGTAVVYPGHPRFSFTDNAEYVYGNSCPLLVIKSKDYNGNSNRILNYLGRYGELFETDAQTYTSTKEKDNDYMIETYVQKNIQVDDIQGENITVLRHLTSGSDISSPSLQMLRFINDKEIITDRFDNPHQAFLEFAAADMQYHYDKTASLRYFDCKPTSVEVACTPHNEEQWQTLEATENEEYFKMPGFGYFYRADLGSVNGSNTWYDLRITLTDEVGNTHVQTLKPAFYIGENSSSINSVYQDNVEEDSRIYSITGCYVGNDEQKLAKGIYIKNGKKIIIQ